MAHPSPGDQEEELEIVEVISNSDPAEDNDMDVEKKATVKVTARRIPDPSAVPAPIDTTRVLQDFKQGVDYRNTLTEATRYLDPWHAETRKQANTLDRLRKWKATQYGGAWGSIKRHLKPMSAKRPSDDDLLKLTFYHFPPPREFTITVVDFYRDRAVCHETTLSECLEKFIQKKPDDVDVRWIHAPLLTGILTEAVHDEFCYAGARTETAPLGSGGKAWPYLGIETLGFMAREDYLAMRDVYSILSENTPDNIRLKQKLDDACEQGVKGAVEGWVSWLSKHLGVKRDFWGLHYGRVPYHLTQMRTLKAGGPKELLNPNNSTRPYQTLWSHPSYRNGQLVRTHMNTRHRPDGMVVTTSPGPDVHYLDKDLDTYLKQSIRKRSSNEDANIQAFIFKRFEKSGTRDWPEKSLRWFMIYMITEFAVAPTNLRQGRAITRLPFAYQQTVERLKMRRYDIFKRNESVELVRDFLTCQDELNCLINVLQGRLGVLDTLHKLACETEEEKEESITEHSPPSDTPCDTSRERVEWAQSVVHEDITAYKELLLDLRSATESLFQIKSIEQNELAIVADSQNKAILVFTAVTVIFLPLSFFTSYFGMNLQGLESVRDQEWFWQVCGTVAFLIVFLTAGWAFRIELRDAWLGKRAPKVRAL